MMPAQDELALHKSAWSDEGQNHENKERNKGDKYDQ